MDFYVVLVVALTLAAAAGVLYYYAMFLEARARQQKRRIAELERANAALLEELRQAKAPDGREGEHPGELWPEVLDGSGDFSRK